MGGVSVKSTPAGCFTPVNLFFFLLLDCFVVASTRDHAVGCCLGVVWPDFQPTTTSSISLSLALLSRLSRLSFSACCFCSSPVGDVCRGWCLLSSIPVGIHTTEGRPNSTHQYIPVLTALHFFYFFLHSADKEQKKDMRVSNIFPNHGAFLYSCKILSALIGCTPTSDTRCLHHSFILFAVLSFSPKSAGPSTCATRLTCP